MTNKQETEVLEKKLSFVFKNFQTLTVVGGNWGDEGKGKIIDLIMGQYDITARFSGGANAGHTVYTPDGKKLAVRLRRAAEVMGTVRTRQLRDKNFLAPDRKIHKICRETSQKNSNLQAQPSTVRPPTQNMNK